jgi:dihydrofolate reductase
LPKFVLSSTLEQPSWANTTVIRGDALDVASKVKAAIDGEIVIPASFGVVRALLEHDLVDELRVRIFPIVLGAGERLFGETTSRRPMRLVDSRTLDGDTTYLVYARAQDASEVSL